MAAWLTNPVLGLYVYQDNDRRLLRYAMKKVIFALLPLFSLAACATGPSLESRMAAYTGDTTTQLVESLGVPDKQITVNGVEYLAYVQRHEVLDPGFYGGGGFYGPYGYGRPFYGAATFYDPGFPPEINDETCTITFVLKAGRVERFTLRGGDCS
jgi:hypothetical protein